MLMITVTIIHVLFVQKVEELFRFLIVCISHTCVSSTDGECLLLQPIGPVRIFLHIFCTSQRVTKSEMYKHIFACNIIRVLLIGNAYTEKYLYSVSAS